jgi:hypothetical protein
VTDKEVTATNTVRAGSPAMRVALLCQKECRWHQNAVFWIMLQAHVLDNTLCHCHADSLDRVDDHEFPIR